MARKLLFVPLGDPQAFKDAVLFCAADAPLASLLQEAPALCTEPLSAADLARPLHAYLPRAAAVGSDTALYWPTGMTADGNTAPAGNDDEASPTATPSPVAPQATSAQDAPTATARPVQLRDRDAVLLAYGREIDSVASFLRSDLSVLVVCDKLVVEHLWRRMAQQAGLRAIPLEGEESEGGVVPRGLRQRQLMALKSLTASLKQGDVLVVSHLDLLAGGDGNLAGEARELIELLYGASQCLLLAFADHSLPLSEVLAARFAVRLELSGVPRTVARPDGSDLLVGDALLTAEEQSRFAGFDAAALYKNIAGMNPVRLRQAIAYAVREHTATGTVPVTALYRAIRAFKAQTSSNFEVPEVTFDDIGGYEDVKAELGRALRLMARSYDLPAPGLERELIPRGFVFHGPPGTGKTLFAKAIANQLNATVQVISGPEVTDMYVGESERKIRALFAAARRNAPAVLVFDELDALAMRRTGRDDGGSRAGNAIVAQILTEMDGFRPDVPMLVIGTTNRLDILDDALLRPSRFQAVAIGMPDTEARRAIAAVHARHFHVEIGDTLLGEVAAATEGFNGDEIRALFRDACVGLYCETPPVPADAARFHTLIERLRTAHAERAVGPA